MLYGVEFNRSETQSARNLFVLSYSVAQALTCLDDVMLLRTVKENTNSSRFERCVVVAVSRKCYQGLG